MSEDQPNSSNGNGHSASRSWLERVAHALAGGEPHDRDGLVAMLRQAVERGLLDGDALAMIEGVIHVTELQAREIMIPRSQVAVLQRADSAWELLPTIVETGHSRFPVTGESRDDVIGILIAKDLLRYLHPDSEASFDLRELLRPALFIPESKRLDALLKLFQDSRNHMAVVVDEYGGLAGIVTIEDVIEQIVGEIDDEHDIEEDTWILSGGDGERTVVKALTPIEDFNEHFATEFSDEGFDTVGGLVAHGFGHVPRRGEVVELGGMRFEVLRADSRRVHLLLVSPVTREVERAATS